MTEMWQRFEPAAVAEGLSPAGNYLARMPDRSGLALPRCDVGQTAVAGLIVNQASFVVVEQLAAWMSEIAASRGHSARQQEQAFAGLASRNRAVSISL